MKILGLDIGTTTVSAVVWQDGRVLDSVTEKNDSFLQTDHSFERLQDVSYISRIAFDVVEQMFAAHSDIKRIGLTGQMHGIVYLDAKGNAVSSLYTWQDSRGDLLCENGESYAAYISRITGHSVASGYGMVTHFYNVRNDLVPATATSFCTIHDYLAMLLAGNTKPIIDPSDAASLGLFDVKKGCFDLDAVSKIGVDKTMLPCLAETAVIGRYKGRADVYVAIGDNQASFLGALDGNRNGMLVNVGTGSQFSVYSRDYMVGDLLETRPFPSGGYLLVGASLCGGRAYALLEKFFRQVGEMLGCQCDSVYGSMERLIQEEAPDDLPKIVPLFCGTRKDPTYRGSIEGLTAENFTPQHLIFGMMEGMTYELYEMYQSYLRSGGEPVALYGSGNGLRKNKRLQICFEKMFEQNVIICDQPEEAATGVAIFADESFCSCKTD